MEKVYKNCQSCGMPLKKDEKGGGTNADGTKSIMYCSHCFDNGNFTQRDITVVQMKERVKGKLKEMGFPGFLAWFFTTNIPRLERWKSIKTMIILVLIWISLMASGQYHPEDSILFEVNTIPVKIDASLPNNIWQIGIPQKAYLNAAWSQAKGIITNTTIPYPINTYSVFSFVIDSKSLKWDRGTYISFMHKFDTDTLADRGLIEASCDGGGHWCALDQSTWTCPNGPVVISWDQDSSATSHLKHNHLAEISGKSDGWLFSRCHLYWIVFDKSTGGTVPDSMMVRFIFTSDGTATGKEGWLIDNIVIGDEDYFTGLPESQDNNHDLTIFPNPVLDQSAFRQKLFAGLVNITIYDHAGRIIRQENDVKPEKIKINRQDFIPGIYLMKIGESHGKSRTTRFTVQ